MLLGFALFIGANAIAQGLIPDTLAGKWVVLLITSTTLWLQRVGLNTPAPRQLPAVSIDGNWPPVHKPAPPQPAAPQPPEK